MIVIATCLATIMMMTAFSKTSGGQSQCQNRRGAPKRRMAFAPIIVMFPRDLNITRIHESGDDRESPSRAMRRDGPGRESARVRASSLSLSLFVHLTNEAPDCPFPPLFSTYPMSVGAHPAALFVMDSSPGVYINFYMSCHCHTTAIHTSQK